MPFSSRTDRLLRSTLLLGAGLILLLCSEAPATAAPPIQGPRARPTDSLTATQVAIILRYGTSVPPPPPRRDRWFARDKARHVVFSGLWTLSTQYVLVNKAGWSEADALPLSVASATAVGVAKELYDASHPSGTVSGKDLVADLVGVGLAVGIIAL